MIVAADHPARGALAVGNRPTAMNSRIDLLDRLRAALADPGVDGVLATSDILDDLLLLGALEDKVVFSSFNRGGLAGASFELDDRMTARHRRVHRRREDERRKDAVPHRSRRSRHRRHDDGVRAGRRRARRNGLIAMLEPFMSSRVNGKVRNDLSPDAVIKSIHIGQGLGLHLGVHVDEAARRRRDGPRDGGDHDADAAARRRSPRSRRGVRQLGEGARRCRRCAD